MRSPNTEVVRLKLLHILTEIMETPVVDYPAGVAIDDMAIWQVGEFREQRAIEQLERIALFDPDTQSNEPLPRTRKKTVVLAKEALTKIRDNGVTNATPSET